MRKKKGLSPRQLEVLQWLFIGKENSEIAAILEISPLTVKNHVQRIIAKLGAHNRENACWNALRLGILKSPYVAPEAPPPPEPPKPLPVVSEAGRITGVVGGVITCFASGEVEIDGKRYYLHEKELGLLKYLAAHADCLHTRQQILDAVWGKDIAVEERCIDVHVCRLRKKFNGSKWRIEMVRGMGYKFVTH